MIECLILGDSLAVGVGQYLPECQTVAKVGISSVDFHVPKIDAETTVISLGSNDVYTSVDHLISLRSRLKTRKVIWIVPVKRNRDQVIAAARRSGDTLLYVDPVKNDGLHPWDTEYPKMAEQIRRMKYAP